MKAVIVLTISACLLRAAADQGSITELQAKKARAEAVLGELERDSDNASEGNDKQQRNRPRMQSQYDPSQIDLSVQQATQALQIEINLQNLFVSYLTTCESRLSELPELSPYLNKLQSAARSLRSSTQDIIANEQQQMSIQRQLQSAYHANDARQWNSLNAQYEAVQAREQQLSATMDPDMAAAKSAIADAKSFLRDRINALNADIARESAAEAERAKAATPAIAPRPAPTQLPAWAHSVMPYLDSHRGNIPLPFLLGWIATESEGNLHAPATNLNERGYFQIHPQEWCYLQERPQRPHCLQSATGKGAKTAFSEPALESAFRRLSTDQEYSLETGIRYIQMNERNIKGLSLNCDQTTNADLFWRLVKLNHSTNYNSVDRLIRDMRSDNVTPNSWRAISDYAKDKANQERLFKEAHEHLDAGIANVNKVFDNAAGLGGSQSQ